MRLHARIAPGTSPGKARAAQLPTAFSSAPLPPRGGTGEDGATSSGLSGLAYSPELTSSQRVNSVFVPGANLSQHYLDSHLSYQRACLHAIDYLTKFGYSAIQAYMILGAAPIEGRLSGVVDIPNSCSTVYIPTAIFDFDVTPSSRGPITIESDMDVPKASF